MSGENIRAPRVVFTRGRPSRAASPAGRPNSCPPSRARGHAIDVFVDEQRRPVSARAGRSTCSRHVPGPERARLRVARGQTASTISSSIRSAILELHEFIWPYPSAGRAWPSCTTRACITRAAARASRATTRRVPRGVRVEPSRTLARCGRTRRARLRRRVLLPLADGPARRRDARAWSRRTRRRRRGGRRRQWPASPVALPSPLGEGPHRSDLRRASAPPRERALGFADDDVVFGVFGGLTAENATAEIFRAFRRTARAPADARLLLAGAPELDPAGADRDDRRRERRSPSAGELDDAAFDQAIAAVDVSLNLRWPSARETSGPWLRALAAGRATIVTDLEHSSTSRRSTRGLAAEQRGRWRPGRRGDRHPRRGPLARARHASPGRRRATCATRSAAPDEPIGSARTRSHTCSMTTNG